MSINPCCKNFNTEKFSIRRIFFILTKACHSIVLLWWATYALIRRMSIVYDINMHRVRSVTNRVLIMNENNTRFNLETHFSRRQAIRFNDSCCLVVEARFVCAEKYRALMKTNTMSIITASDLYNLFVLSAVSTTGRFQLRLQIFLIKIQINVKILYKFLYF